MGSVFIDTIPSPLRQKQSSKYIYFLFVIAEGDVLTWGYGLLGRNDQPLLSKKPKKLTFLPEKRFVAVDCGLNYNVLFTGMWEITQFLHGFFILYDNIISIWIIFFNENYRRKRTLFLGEMWYNAFSISSKGKKASNKCLHEEL